MKKIIIKLILDDIKITRLINTLSKLDIEAGDYYLNASSVIFDLMKINDEMAREHLFVCYSKMIEKGCQQLPQYIGKDKKLAAETYKLLLSKKN